MCKDTKQNILKSNPTIHQKYIPILSNIYPRDIKGL